MPHSSGRWLYGVANVDDRLDAVSAPDLGEALEVEDAIVRVGRRLAEQNARVRPDRLRHRFVVTGWHRRALDAVAVQRLVQELAGAPVRVVGDHDVRAARQHGEQRRGDRRHAARHQEAIAGAFQGGELLLGDPLRGVAVAAVLFALDPVLEVVAQLLGVGERVGRRLHDRRGQRVARLLARLAGVHRGGAESERLARRRGRGVVRVRSWLPRAHYEPKSRLRSTWRAIVSATCLASAGSSTGRF
jgi:hypothetical protein